MLDETGASVVGQSVIIDKTHTHTNARTYKTTKAAIVINEKRRKQRRRRRI